MVIRPELPACDVAVVCLKTTQNEQLPELLKGCVKPDGVVLVLQNGLKPEAKAAKIVGAGRVLGGLCFLCSNKVGPGHIQHLDYGHIHMGVYHESPERDNLTPADHHLPGVVEDFNAAGIETTQVEDLRLSRWKKLVWNIPYNGLSVVLNQTTDVMMADPPTRQRIEAIMHEVQAAALAVDGKVIEDEFIETMLSYTAKDEAVQNQHDARPRGWPSLRDRGHRGRSLAGRPRPPGRFARDRDDLPALI